MASVIGYARVSTVEQSTENQVTALKAAGCNVVRQEKASGRSREGRSELETILDFIQSGDTLVVVRLDRLGRSTRDVLNLVHELEAKGCHLRVLEPAIETSGPMGKVILTVLSMVAEMEVGFIRERQAAGIAAAKAKGIYRGRPAKLDHQKIRQLRAEGMGATEIASTVGCSRAMVYKAFSTDNPAAPSD